MAAPILTENEINAKFNQAEARAQEWEFPEIDGLYAEHEDKISPPVKEEPKPEPTKEESSGVMSQDEIDKLVPSVKEEKPDESAESKTESPDGESMKQEIKNITPTPPPPPKEENAIMDPDDIAALVANLSGSQTESTEEISSPVIEDKEPVMEQTEPTKPAQKPPVSPPEKNEDSNSMMGQDEIEALLNSMNAVKTADPAPMKQPEPEPESEESEIDLSPSPEELEALLGSGITDEDDTIDESDILAADDIAASFTQKEVTVELDIPDIIPDKISVETDLPEDRQEDISGDISGDIPETIPTEDIKAKEIENISGLADDSELQDVITAKLEKVNFPLPEDKTENLAQSMERLLARTSKIQNSISDMENQEKEDSATQFDEKAFAEMVRPIQEKASQKAKTANPETTDSKITQHKVSPPDQKAEKRISRPGLKTKIFALGVAAVIMLAFFHNDLNLLQKTAPFLGMFLKDDNNPQWQTNPNPESEVRARFKTEWNGQIVRGTLSYLNDFRIVSGIPRTENNEINPHLIRSAIDNYYSSIEGPKNKLGRKTWWTDGGQIGENEPHFYVDYFTPKPDHGHLIRKSVFLQHEKGILKLDLVSTPAKEEDILKPSSKGWRALTGVMESKLSGSVTNHQEEEGRNLIISDPDKFAQSLLELYKLVK